MVIALSWDDLQKFDEAASSWRPHDSDAYSKRRWKTPLQIERPTRQSWHCRVGQKNSRKNGRPDYHTTQRPPRQ